MAYPPLVIACEWRAGAFIMSRADLEREARNARDLAVRARRLAQGLSLASDRERLNHFADGLDERAAEMEAEAAALRPITPKGLRLNRGKRSNSTRGKHHLAAPSRPRLRWPTVDAVLFGSE